MYVYDMRHETACQCRSGIKCLGEKWKYTVSKECRRYQRWEGSLQKTDASKVMNPIYGHHSLRDPEHRSQYLTSSSHCKHARLCIISLPQMARDNTITCSIQVRNTIALAYNFDCYHHDVPQSQRHLSQCLSTLRMGLPILNLLSMWSLVTLVL